MADERTRIPYGPTMLVLVVVAVLGSTGIALFIPPQHDERLYLLMAREIDAPDFEIPRRPAIGGSHFIGNPPLVVFSASVSRAWLGDDHRAQRVFHILLFLPAFLVFTYRLTRFCFGPRAGLFSVLLAVLAEPVLAHAASVRLDLSLAAAVVAAMDLGLRSLHGGPRSRLCLVGSSVALGVAVFTKYEAIVIPLTFGLHGIHRSIVDRRIHGPSVRVLLGHTAASAVVLGGWFLWIANSPADLAALGHVTDAHMVPPTFGESVAKFLRILKRTVLFVGLPIFGLAILGGVVALRRRRAGRRGRRAETVPFLLCWIASVMLLQFVIERSSDRHYLKMLPAVFALAASVPALAMKLPRGRDERRMLIALAPLSAAYLCLQLGVSWPGAMTYGALGFSVLLLLASLARPVASHRLVRSVDWRPVAVLAAGLLLQQLATPNNLNRFGPEMRTQDANARGAGEWARLQVGAEAAILVQDTQFGIHAGRPFALGSTEGDLERLAERGVDVRAVIHHGAEPRNFAGFVHVRTVGEDVQVHLRLPVPD